MDLWPLPINQPGQRSASITTRNAREDWRRLG
jgi:hypothetical protein